MELFKRTKFGHLHSETTEELIAIRADKGTSHNAKGAITRILRERDGTKNYSGNLAQRRARAVNFLKLVSTGARGSVNSARYQLHEIWKELPSGEQHTLGRLLAKSDQAILFLEQLTKAIEEEFPSKQKAPKDGDL